MKGDSGGDLPERRNSTSSTEEHIRELQLHDNVTKRLFQQPLDQQRLTVSPDKSPLRQTDRTVEEKPELERIDRWLEMHREKLASPLPEITFSPPDLTSEDQIRVAAIDRFDKVVPDLSRLLRLRVFEKLRKRCDEPRTQSPQEGSLEEVRKALGASSDQDLKDKINKLEDDCNELYKTYKEKIGEPFWRELEKMKEERARIRRQLADLHRQKEILQDIHLHATEKSEQDGFSSSKSESSEASRLSNQADDLIRDARTHEATLCEEIKKGHQSLLDLSRKWKVLEHPYFLQEQMKPYQLEEGRVHLASIGCGPSCVTMLASDIDPKFGNEHAVAAASKKYPYLRSSGATRAGDNAMVINSLQSAVTYRTEGPMSMADLHKALAHDYQGKELASMVRIVSRYDSTSYPQHLLAIHRRGQDSVSVRDPIAKEEDWPYSVYSVGLDDLAEVWDRIGIIPGKPRIHDSIHRRLEKIQEKIRPY